MSEKILIAPEFLDLVLGALNDKAPRPRLGEAALLATYASVGGKWKQSTGTDGLWLADAVECLLLTYGVPSETAALLSAEIHEWPTESLRLLEWIVRTASGHGNFAQQTVRHVVQHLYSITRGEPDSNAGRPVGRLFAQFLNSLQPEAENVSFSSLTGQAYAYDTVRELAVAGRDPSEYSVAASFASLRDAVLTSAQFDHQLGYSLTNSQKQLTVSDALYPVVNELAYGASDAVFGVLVHPTWARNRGYPGEWDAPLAAAFSALRDDGTLYLLTTPEVFTRVAVDFLDNTVLEEDLLTAIVLLSAESVTGHDGLSALLLIQPSKASSLTGEVLVVHAEEGTPSFTELAGLTVNALSNIDAGVELPPGSRLISTAELQRSHYQAAVRPEPEPREVFEERIAELQAKAEKARIRRERAIEEFTARAAQAKSRLELPLRLDRGGA